MKDYVAKFGQGNAKMARQAQSKEKILDKMLKSGVYVFTYVCVCVYICMYVRLDVLNTYK